MVLMLILYKDSIRWIPFVLFQGTQATFLQFWTPECLRGYGCGTPNGSLWTIGVMVQCYVVMWIMYGLLHGKSVKRWIFALATFIVLNIAKQFSGLILPGIIDKLFGQTFIPYLWMFLVGAVITEHFDSTIVLLRKYWWALFIMAQVIRISGFDLGVYGTVHFSLLILAVLGFGYKVNNIRIKRDISYGLYIYHMVVINAMIALGYTGQGLDIVISFLTAVALAVASYYSVGAIGRKLKAQQETTDKKGIMEGA